jgi:hypothetical protein
MGNLVPEESKIVRGVLSWLLVGQRQLHTKEVLELVDTRTTTQAVLSLCADFVVLDSTQDLFRFSHLSVREFLEEKTDVYGPLVLHDLATSMCISRVVALNVHAREDYACLYWLAHAEAATQGGTASPCEKSLHKLLCQPSKEINKWNRTIHEAVVKRRLSERSAVEEKLAQVLTKDFKPILVAASYGLTCLLNSMLNEITAVTLGQQINHDGSHAVVLSAKHGYVDNVLLLLGKGANINAGGGEYGTALQAASAEGHAFVVDMLLKHEADVDAKGGEDGTALQAASIWDHETIVQLLLDNGANVNAKGGKYGNALSAACWWNNQSIVQILLDRGADLNAALVAACYLSHTKSVRMLLSKGADVNAADKQYGTALEIASHEGNIEIVRMLLNKDANVYASGGKFFSAIFAALFLRRDARLASNPRRHWGVVATLLKHVATAPKPPRGRRWVIRSDWKKSLSISKWFNPLTLTPMRDWELRALNYRSLLDTSLVLKGMNQQYEFDVQVGNAGLLALQSKNADLQRLDERTAWYMEHYIPLATMELERWDSITQCDFLSWKSDRSTDLLATG